MRGEAEAAAAAHHCHDRGRAQPAMVDLLIQAEREVVVATERAHLVADQNERTSMPTLLARAARGEGVVVCEQHHVRGRLLRGPRDLGHGAGAVGVGGVQVHHTREIAQAVHSATRQTEYRRRCATHAMAPTGSGSQYETSR